MVLEHYSPPIVVRGDIFAYLFGPRALFLSKYHQEPVYAFEFETPVQNILLDGKREKSVWTNYFLIKLKAQLNFSGPWEKIITLL